MKDYAEGSTKPWESKGDVKQIIICEGVTHIGDHAFANSPATRVSLPESLTSIGTRAFAGAAIHRYDHSRQRHHHRCRSLLGLL